MERSQSVSSGPAHQDDSWTCQRCGWVYPNAHPSAKHRRNHKKQCGKIKGSGLRSELPKGGSSDEASSGDDSHTKKENLPPQSTTMEVGSGVPAVELPNAPQSRDLLVTEMNVPDKKKSDTPILQGISGSLDAKPEVTDHESTREIINIDAVKTESPAPEPEPNFISLDKTSKIFEEGEVPAHISPGLCADEAKEFVKKDIKREDPAIDLTKNKALTTVEEHSISNGSQVDGLETVVRDLPGLNSDQADSADSKDANSEVFSPKDTEFKASLEEPSKIFQEESKVILTPCVDRAMAKETLLMSKEQGLNRQGSSQGDDSWTCRRCSWVYPNPHPSAKHRKKHKKQCGKIKGFELHTEPLNGGSSDEISSDEDVHAKKGHVLHQSPQSQEQANEMVATESLPSIVDHRAIFVGGEMVTESESNSLQPKDFSALKVVAPDGELREAPKVKDISTPDIVPSVVPELPQDLPSLDQQNPPASDNKKDAVVLDQVMKVSRVSDEPDSSLTKESPKHSIMNDASLPNEAFVQEIVKSSKTELNAIPSAPISVDILPSEGCGDPGKDTPVEHGLTATLAEEPAELSGECTPNVASIPSVPDLKSSETSPPAYFDGKGASVQVDKPSAVVISAVDARGVGLRNGTLDASAGAGPNQNVILKEERDVSENRGLSGLDTASSLDALDDTRVGDPLRKETGDALTGGSDGQLEPENSNCTLPADNVPVENKAVTENLLPLTALSTANVTGLANDAEQTSVIPAQLAPKNELLVEIVEGGNADTFSSTLDKTNETPPVTNMAHSFHNGTTSVGAAEVDVPKEVTISAVTTGEAVPIQKSLDGFASKNVSPVSEDSSQGATGDVPKELTIPAVTTGEAISIPKSLDGFASKNVSSVSEDSSLGATGADTENTKTTSFIAEDTGVSDIARENEAGGFSSIKDVEQDGEQENTESSGALEAMAKPEAEEETLFESRGIGSSDSSYTETYSFTRSESGVTARSELGSSSHKLSDSLEIFEDAQDSLETCSVGGSVEENEILDEPRQASASDRLQEEPKHFATASLDERVPSERVVLEPVLNGSRFGEASYEEKAPTLQGTSYEEKAPTLQGTSYEEKDKAPTLPVTSYEERAPTLQGTIYEEKDKAPTLQATSYEEKAPTLSGTSYEEKASIFPGTSYGGRNEMKDLKAPSPEAWQEPGPSNVRSEGKKITASEVTEDSKSGESHTALRSLMAKEGPGKADPIVETSTAAGDPNKVDGSLASANGRKTKSRSFWRNYICCSTVH